MKLVYISPVPWNSVAQRPHFFVNNALKYGFESVLWVEPTPSRLPKLIDFKTIVSSVEADSFPKDSRIKLIKPRMFPVEPIQFLYKLVNYRSFRVVLNEVDSYTDPKNTIFVSGKPSLLSIYILKKLKFHRTIVDVMDDFPFFFDGIAKESMSGLLKDVITCTDQVIFSSNKLLSKYGGLSKDCKLIKNACDQSFIDNVASVKKNENLKNSKVKVFGYIGSIGKWFDWDAVIKLAKENTNSIVKIIGPNYSLSIPKLPENIFIEPAIEHSNVPFAMQEFDYGLIPFKINDLTDSVDPVKYYEYIASGLPVISSAFGEMKYRIENNAVYSFSSNLECPLNKEEIVTWNSRFDSFYEELIN